ncbi:MAG: hypothetical protein O6761_06990 [Thaumarchaeota archaeon]|nr:hypothetical protein [Nitrososphaerota archaeon]
MSAPESGDYGDASQAKALAGVRQAIIKYDEEFKLGIESGNRYLDDGLFPITLTLPLTTEQFDSATFIVNYHAVMLYKMERHASPTEVQMWEKRRDSALVNLTKKIEASTTQSAKARTFTAKSRYRSFRLRRIEPI